MSLILSYLPNKANIYLWPGSGDDFAHEGSIGPLDKTEVLGPLFDDRGLVLCWHERSLWYFRIVFGRLGLAWKLDLSSLTELNLLHQTLLKAWHHKVLQWNEKNNDKAIGIQLPNTKITIHYQKIFSRLHLKKLFGNKVLKEIQAKMDFTHKKLFIITAAKFFTIITTNNNFHYYSNKQPTFCSSAGTAASGLACGVGFTMGSCLYGWNSIGWYAVSLGCGTSVGLGAMYSCWGAGGVHLAGSSLNVCLGGSHRTGSFLTRGAIGGGGGT